MAGTFKIYLTIYTDKNNSEDMLIKKVLLQSYYGVTENYAQQLQDGFMGANYELFNLAGMKSPVVFEFNPY